MPAQRMRSRISAGSQVLVVRQGFAAARPRHPRRRSRSRCRSAQARGVGDRALLDGDDGARAGCMHRRADVALGLADLLALAAPASPTRDQRLGRGADVLLQRDDQNLGDRGLGHRLAVRQRLLVRQVDAAVELPQTALVRDCLGAAALDVPRLVDPVSSSGLRDAAGSGGVGPLPTADVFRDRHHVDALDRAGRRHSSQPVHSLAMMVCICLAAPMMASTGQACRQSVQPMHSCSSMTATALGFSSPPSSATGSLPSRSASASTRRLAAGHALVDLGVALGHRLRIGLATREAALPALGLGQDARRPARRSGRPRCGNGSPSSRAAARRRRPGRRMASDGGQHGWRHRQDATSPAKPMKASDIRPAVTRAMALPWKGSGTSATVHPLADGGEQGEHQREARPRRRSRRVRTRRRSAAPAG